MICVQTFDFSVEEQLSWLTEDNQQDGAVVTFVGRVRNNNTNREIEHKVVALELEHYPAMTEKSIEQIVDQANQRWSLGKVSVVHRVGRLQVGEQIVFVGVTSAHRKAAFEACEFIMDYLKVKAPFWKKEITEQGDVWLDAKKSDSIQSLTWLD